MLDILRSIFAPSPVRTDAGHEALIQTAIERVVDGTDPRLRAVVGYKKRLTTAVARSVEYVTGLVDSLSPAVEISRKAFSSDAQLCAVFVSADHLQEVISSSYEIRDYLHKAALKPIEPIGCLLSMDLSQKKVLGVEQRGEILQRDVVQVAVNFSDHRLVGITSGESETRWEIKKRAFDHLIEAALLRILSVHTTRKKLDQQHQLLRAKLRAMKAGNCGLESVLTPADGKYPDRVDIERQISAIEAELLAIRIGPATLKDLLECVASTLSAPSEYLRLERVSLTLDAMNITRSEPAGASATTLILDEVMGGDRRRIVLLGRIPHTDITDVLSAHRRLDMGRAEQNRCYYGRKRS